MLLTASGLAQRCAKLIIEHRRYIMFYVKNNDGEFKGFNNAKEAVETYSKLDEKTGNGRDIGLLITKEPIAEKSIEQVLQEQDWLTVSCVQRIDS